MFENTKSELSTYKLQRTISEQYKFEEMNT